MRVRTQMLVCEVSAIVLLGYAVNCLSNDLTPTSMATMDGWALTLGLLLPISWSLLGALVSIAYGSHLANERDSVQQWTTLHSVWEMLVKGLPKTAAANEASISTYLTDPMRLVEIYRDSAKTRSAGLEEDARIESENPAWLALSVPAFSLFMALAIKIAWGYGCI